MEVLTQLADDPEELVRKYVAANPSTPVEVLMRLADDSEKWVLEGLAENPSTPVEVLTRLADHSEERVLKSLAQNPSTPVEVLTALASKEGYRQAVTWNPTVKALVDEAKESTDEARLSELGRVSPPTVREAVARNPHTPVEVLTRLADDPEWRVREHVAENPRTPADVLVVLASDSSGAVRERVAKNPSAPTEAQDLAGAIAARRLEAETTSSVEALTVLAGDSIDEVREAALFNPACPNEVREASGMVFMFMLERTDFSNDSFDMQVPELDFLKDLTSAPVEVLYPSGRAPRFEIVRAGADIEWTTDRYSDDHNYLVWCGGGAPDWWSDWSLIEDFLGSDAVAALARGDESLFERNQFKAAERVAYTGHAATMEAWAQVREDLATMFTAGQSDEPSSDTPPQELLAIVDRWLREDAWRKLSEMAHRAIVSALARHPSTPVPVLEELAVSEYESVRWLVTRNPSATDEIRASAVLMGVDAEKFTGQIPDEDLSVDVDLVHLNVDVRVFTREEFAEEFPEMMDDPDSDWVTSDGEVAVDSRTGEIPDEIEEYLVEWFQDDLSAVGSVTELNLF